MYFVPFAATSFPHVNIPMSKRAFACYARFSIKEIFDHTNTRTIGDPSRATGEFATEQHYYVFCWRIILFHSSLDLALTAGLLWRGQVFC